MDKIAVIYDDIFLQHETFNHPENPMRLRRLTQELKNAPFIDRLQWFAPVPTDEKELQLIHSPEMINFIKETALSGGGLIDPDTWVSPGSYNAALAAAGAGKVALGLVFHRGYQVVFVPARPPGH
ncbi:MAG: histone deacetylase, partial [Rubrivivax sp.]|nr:histone deacetylase [Rubrivivax sp.]